MQLQIVKILLAGYTGIMLLGASVLTLPTMHNGDVDFMDALFTSISALTCTGLIIKDTALDFTFLGQVVILILIQVGGFGYMSLLGILYLLVGKRLSNMEKNLIKQNISHTTIDGVDIVIKRAFFFVIAVEVAGSVVLSAHFVHTLKDLKLGIWAGIFHAVSAFNNAGFSIFSTNLYEYKEDILVNLVVCTLVVIGGIGYVCCSEVGSLLANIIKRRILGMDITKVRLSLNAKVVVFTTIVLIILGTSMIMCFEWSNHRSIGNDDYLVRIMSSVFLSINYRTSGFATLDIDKLNDSTVFFSVFFMNVGGGPGGTASGIKVTTLAVLMALSYSIIRHKRDVLIFNRKIEDEAISKSFSVLVLSCVYMFTSAFLLALFEPNLGFLPILFEVSSAFSTVGLSIGDGGILSLCANFNPMGLMIVMILMVSGKIGILTFTLMFIGSVKKGHTKCIQEKIII